MAQHVAIIGGGFSGAMLAVQLLRRGARVSLVERRPQAALGLAYGAAHPAHLLNVRAANMSAFPDDPAHFARWLAERGQAEAGAAFAPRPVYGTYLQDIFATAAEAAGDRLKLIHRSAEALHLTGSGVTIRVDEGDAFEADAAVLAIGNLPPHAPRGIEPESLEPGRYWGDPWQPGVAAGLGAEDRVLVIGTGLTMVDMVLLLETEGFTGSILALSRRGLLPHAHGPAQPFEARRGPPEGHGSGLVRELRERAKEIGWRQAVDELRPFTQGMWAGASDAQRSRFVRHLRPWWDVHRHRIAPQVHERVQTMIQRGQLRVAAGKLLGSSPTTGGAHVSWRPRGSDRVETFSATRIVNCTGPEGNLPSSPEVLLRNLLVDGLIRPGPLGLGVDVDAEARVIRADGSPEPRIRAVGPLTRGNLWEIVAVPDVRVQVARVAEQMTKRG